MSSSHDSGAGEDSVDIPFDRPLPPGLERGERQLHIAPGTPEKSLRQAARVLTVRAHNDNWRLADLLLYSKRHGHSAVVGDIREALQNAKGSGLRTLQQVAVRIPPEMRRFPLSFTHYRIVATRVPGYPKECEQHAPDFAGKVTAWHAERAVPWLKLAVEEGLSTGALLSRIEKARTREADRERSGSGRDWFERLLCARWSGGRLLWAQAAIVLLTFVLSSGATAIVAKTFAPTPPSEVVQLAPRPPAHRSAEPPPDEGAPKLKAAPPRPPAAHTSSVVVAQPSAYARGAVTVEEVISPSAYARGAVTFEEVVTPTKSRPSAYDRGEVRLEELR